MTPSTPNPPASQLGRRTATGLAWLGVQTTLLKPVSVGTQLVLAWLLSPEIFGLVGMTYTVTTFVDLLQQAGVSQVLIHRHRAFDLWSTPAFFISLATALAASLLLLLVAPAVAAVYQQPELVRLLGVMALVPPIRALGLVPHARLQADLRYKPLARIQISTYVLQAVLSVILAWAGLGAFSVLLPIAFCELLRVVAYWRITAMRWPRRPRWRRCRYLIADTSQLLASEIFSAVRRQGDYIILAILYGAGDVGLYFFAFSLSAQSIQMFTGNLAKVLFPTLSQLQHDPRRQVRAFIKAARLLTIIAVPACLLQAAVAEDLIRGVYGAKWLGVIPLLQILSIAFAVRAVGGANGGLLMAQGRFKTLMRWSASTSMLFLACVAGGAAFSVIGAALGVLLFSITIGPCGVYLAIRVGGGRWRDVGQIYLRPLILSAAAVLLGWLASRWVPQISGFHFIRMAVILLVGVTLYLLLMQFFLRERVDEFRQRLRELLAKRRTT